MPNIVGVRFRRAGKVYYFDPAGHDLSVDNWVVVDTARGSEVGQVVLAPRQVAESELKEPLKPVLRPASISDLRSMQAYRLQESDAVAKVREETARHGLPMKIVGAEYSFDGTRLTFYFTAEGRVDFRDLVRDLVRTFKARIELRQVGARDETKIMDGMGICGRRLCCAAFLDCFDAVSIRMAKAQDLPLNPAKISGQCGRLLCCLGYEEALYREAKARLPKVGEEIETVYGLGRVKDVEIIAERLRVEYASGNVKDITVEQLGPPPAAPSPSPEPEPEWSVRPRPAERPKPTERPESPEAQAKRRRPRHPSRAPGQAATPASATQAHPTGPAAPPARPGPGAPARPAGSSEAKKAPPEGEAKPKRPAPRHRRPRRRPEKKPI